MKLTVSISRKATRLLTLGVTLAAVTLSQMSFAKTDTPPPMLFEQLGINAGLSQSNVLAVLQDSRGLMWFGTENGLDRYDGYRFEHFKRERANPKALHNDFIFDIAEDASGDLWIATNGGGLARFDRATEQFESFLASETDENAIPSNHIRKLLIDADGMIWLATKDAGLARFNPSSKKFESVAFSQDIASVGGLYALMHDASGRLWVGGDHGLSRLDPASGELTVWQHDMAEEGSLAKGSVRDVLQDSFGTIWVATYGGGLSQLKADESGFQSHVHDTADALSLSGNRITKIFEDRDRRLWVGTTAGLNLVDRRTGAIHRFTNDASDAHSLSNNRVTSIFQDRSGLLWIGTQTQGVNKWNPRSWDLGFEPAKSLTVALDRSPNITSFSVDEAGVLWLGTLGDGLHAVDRQSGKTTHYRTSSEAPYMIADDRVMSVLHDRDGSIWIGTMTKGLLNLDAKTGEQKQYTHSKTDNKSLGANGVTALHQDSAGRLWVGTYGGGISRMDPQTGDINNFRHDPDNSFSLTSNRVLAFAEDPSGMMWVGTEGGGLSLFEPTTGRFHQFLHDTYDTTTLAGDTVYAINVDNAGTVWVGTRSGGLDRVVGDVKKPEAITFENISERDGLANDVVYGIEFDNAGWIWMSTNYGISRYNASTGEFRNITQREGLQSNEFNFGAHYSSAVGELFFGGHNGFNAFRPGEVKANTVAPLIALTGFFNGNDSVRSDLPIDDDGTVDVGWNQNDIAFEFAALDFTASDRNRYQYMLEGRDEQWVDLGYNRRITYTDLNDGLYELRVRAANSDGVWSENGLTLPIRVSPAPWDTWWAYLIYALAAVAASVALFNFHRNRMAREAAYSRRLEEEVQQRTEKLVESNSALESMNGKLQESSLSDPLTGLRNRRFVFEEISRDIEAIQRRYNESDVDTFKADASELVFMMIDLDHFKPINDTYGHAAGDAMLLAIRDLLLDICRRSDSVVRWGGDEFVIIAKQSKPEESEALAERIRSAIETHQFDIGEGIVARTTCSIGFVAYPLFHRQQETSSLDHMISVADGLMYEAKRQRNAWVGMLSPDSAVTSENFDHKAVEATSLLFRARRAQNVDRRLRPAEGAESSAKVLSIGELGA